MSSPAPDNIQTIAYNGLVSVGRIQAKIFFVMVVLFFILFLIIWIVQFFSALNITRNSNNYSTSQKNKAKQKRNALLLVFIIVTLVFSVVLYLSYVNMIEAEKSKQYAAATGLLDVVQDVRSIV